MAEVIQYYGTGRRKTAIARVYLRPGSGDFKVNGREFEEYFVTPSQRVAAKQPLASTETGGTFNVLANVSGGGVDGQADAVDGARTGRGGRRGVVDGDAGDVGERR